MSTGILGFRRHRPWGLPQQPHLTAECSLTVTPSPPQYGTSSCMHQVILHSTITHPKKKKGNIQQNRYTRWHFGTATGVDADFSFPISATVKTPVSTVYLLSWPGTYVDGRIYRYRAASTSEITMLLVWSNCQQISGRPALLWRNLVRKIAHNTTASSTNYCIRKTGHE